MIVIYSETKTKSSLKYILLIDAHSHLGKDEDGLQNMNPLSPEGTFNFYAQINNALQEKLGDHYNFQITLNNQLNHFSFKFEPFPFSYNLYKSISEICKCGTHPNLFNKTKGSWLIDQGVIFPFQDIFRDRQPEALYRASNLNISRFTTKFPYSIKLIGFARCNPMEGSKATAEIRNATENLGLRGLKLHPRSDLWLNEITDNNVSLVLIEAARHSIPVIIDTRGKQSILDIHQLVKNTRVLMKNIKQSYLIPHLKVIIAHCAMGYIGDFDIYEAISDPNTFGEISMLHGKGSAEFYISFMEWYKEYKQLNKKRWSENIIFGTDFPYFSANHARDNIVFLLSQEFIEKGGTFNDTENILGLNILKTFTEYNYKIIQQEPRKATYIHLPMSTETPTGNFNVAIKILSKLLENKVINISKINFLFSESYQNYQNELLIQTQSNEINQTIKFLYMKFIKNKYFLLSNLIQNKIRNPTNFKYFTPNDNVLLLHNFPFNFGKDESSLYNSFRNLYK
ncbi:MAG: amidohydrolase family protein [Promethearchaeota archaeon]